MKKVLMLLLVLFIACSDPNIPQGEADSDAPESRIDLQSASEHYISSEVADTLMISYRNAFPDSTRGAWGGSFSSSAFESILAQPGCARIKYYYVMKKTGERALIITCADEDNKDFGQALEYAHPCPPYCG